VARRTSAEGLCGDIPQRAAVLENSREEENQISSIRLIKKLVKNRKIKSKCTEDDGGTLKT
jgi:hypothetical protein